MSIKYSLLALAATLMIQPAFADEDMSSDEKPCAPVAKPCLDAGYIQHDSEGKQFWKNCMKPLLLAKSVPGVTVDPKDVKTCRAAKIKQLQSEIKELKEVK